MQLQVNGSWWHHMRHTNTTCTQAAGGLLPYRTTTAARVSKRSLHLAGLQHGSGFCTSSLKPACFLTLLLHPVPATGCCAPAACPYSSLSYLF
jgi:hypothetical protein